MNARLQIAMFVTILGGAWAAPSLAQPFAERFDAGSFAFDGQGAVLDLEQGAGRLIHLDRPAATVLTVDPEIAKVVPASATSVFVLGIDSGTTQMIVTDQGGRTVKTLQIRVRSSVSKGSAFFDPNELERLIHTNVARGDDIHVETIPNGILLRGTAPSPAAVQQASAIARTLAGSKITILNNVEVLSSIQVNVRVRIVEASRSLMRQLGFNWQILYGTGKFALGLATGGSTVALTPGLPASSQALGQLNGRSAGINTGVPARVAGGISTSNLDLNGVVDALAEQRRVKILAEPNLTALSGETASFLAGGEFPIPVAATQTGQISIEFKEYGVSLSVVPTVLSPGRLNLKIRPEVSELTEVGSVNLPIAGGSIVIPALAVRRAETTVELGSGQSFAIAGLLQNASTKVVQSVPGLSDIPIIGALFKSKSFRNDQTELVIIVTPYLVKPTTQQALTEPDLDDHQQPASQANNITPSPDKAMGESAEELQ